MADDRERIRGCGPLSECARNGHADRRVGEFLEDHAWSPGREAHILWFEKTCLACEQGLHDRCWAYLGDLMGYEYVPCPCGCWDEYGELTRAALMDMMRRQPEALARKIRFDAAFAERSSFRFHLRRG